MSETNHCRDCCCARSWEALGVTTNTGKSIVEHIEELRATSEDLYEALEMWADGFNSHKMSSSSKAAQKFRSDLWEKTNAALKKARGE